jgi:small ligand-binding sensory domain FIST
VHNAYSVAAHWRGPFDEQAIQEWAQALRTKFDAPKVSLGLVFLAPGLFAHAAQILEIVQVHGRVPMLVGCSSPGLVAGSQEFEEDAGISLGLYWLPDAELHAIRVQQEHLDDGDDPAYWRQQLESAGVCANSWLAFADPFHLDIERWLAQWNAAFAPSPIVGGLAGGIPPEQRTQIYLNGEVFEDGAVAVAIGGKVRLATVVSQGCTPIGDTWIITKTDRNLVQQIANRPAYQVLVETFSQLPGDEQKKARGNLFLGLAMNEYLEEFRRGDFLVRNLLGGDPTTGNLAVDALPRPGQTLQFHRRDASAASEDLRSLLEHAGRELAGVPIYGACLCVCNGRGKHLFGQPHHDAGLVQDRLGPMGLTGFFCNGEIGPVGGRSYLHGYTASLALFVKR